ncbi:tyrosine-type recombinase/integrase [Parasedimentitalea maritima]|uniref:DUF4102 domain-containing protein n=1 Tax=Parasedimentitalea maritima TaxID=2578117 RepID=A0A6A4RG79_9RHOB|nr:integrase arm-type DNA-binding domain-containing protein [Zongyanglinia marina]KAE9627821.1 DUF4102 domain-containing protein [Zongyanglinia marina]
MTSSRPPLTQAMINAALKARTQTQVLRDGKVPGLSLRIGVRSASYYLSYKPLGRRPDGRQFSTQDYKIGTTESHSLSEARREAARLKVEATSGRDPAATRRALKASAASRPEHGETMSAAVERYISTSLRGSKKHIATESGALRLAVKEMAAQDKAPAEVTTDNILTMLAIHHGRPRAVHRLGALSRFFDDLVSRDIVASNPCARIPKRNRPSPPPSRTRVFTATEVQKLLGCELPPVRRRFLTTATLLPLRFTELSELRWRNIDRDDHRLHLSHLATKNGDPFTIPVHEGLLEGVLMQPADTNPDSRVFQLAPKGGEFKSWSTLNNQVRKASGIEDFNFHHLRRTFFTCMAELGLADQGVTDALLNHRQSATRSGVIGAYNHSRLWPQKIEAMNRWYDAVQAATYSGSWTGSPRT